VESLTTQVASTVRLKQSGRAPGHLGADPEVEDVLAVSFSRRLLCAVCAEPVTADDHRIAIAGRHRHRRTNPAGIDYTFGCFSQAPGAAAVGPSSVEHTWFAGFSWRIAICRGCGAHLGWRFEAAGSAFHGLILDRLEAERMGEG
jgi:hypothetical protein